MNYIAHSLISLEKDKKTLFGNFSGDFYKGKVGQLKLPSNVLSGIILHRHIDTLTDTNNKLVSEIDNKYGHYKGIMSDIFIDHYVSLNIEKLTNNCKLKDVTDEIISEVDMYERYYTARFSELYKWIKYNDILNKYKDIKTLKLVFNGISKRVRNGEILNFAVDELERNYKRYEEIAIMEFLRVKREVK